MLDFGGLADAIEHAIEAAGGRQTKLDEEHIRRVRARLEEASSLFAGHSFRAAKIPNGSFGGLPTGHELGTHHSRAQDVIQETLHGIVEDLDAFAANVHKAASLVRDTDGQATHDMAAKQKLVEKMDGLVDHFHNDDAYNTGRNQHHYDWHHHQGAHR